MQCAVRHLAHAQSVCPMKGWSYGYKCSMTLCIDCIYNIQYIVRGIYNLCFVLSFLLWKMKSLPVPALFVGIFLLQDLCKLTLAKSFTKTVPFQSWKAPAGQSRMHVCMYDLLPYFTVLPFLFTITETVTNYQIVSPVVRFKSDDLSAKVGLQLAYTGCLLFVV